MARWYEMVSARIGLRVAGLALLVSAWTEGGLLRALVHDHVGRSVDPSQLMLACLIFASASAGAMLAIVGAGLWAPVELSARWASAPDPTL